MTTILKWALALCILGVAAGQLLSHKKFETAQVAAAPVMQQAKRAAPLQVQPPQPNGTVVLDPASNGHYQAQIEINGRLVTSLVDTGASYVSLTAEDARAIGIYPGPSEFTWRMNTANGQSRVAPVKLDSVRIGTLSLYNVEAIVMEPGASQTNLLGMTFLKKLTSFGVEQGRLILRQ